MCQPNLAAKYFIFPAGRPPAIECHRCSYISCAGDMTRHVFRMIQHHYEFIGGCVFTCVETHTRHTLIHTQGSLCELTRLAVCAAAGIDFRPVSLRSCEQTYAKWNNSKGGNGGNCRVAHFGRHKSISAIHTHSHGAVGQFK